MLIFAPAFKKRAKKEARSFSPLALSQGSINNLFREGFYPTSSPDGDSSLNSGRALGARFFFLGY
jgi:hypothetical protein